MQLIKGLKNYIHYLRTQNELKLQLYNSDNILLLKKCIHISNVFKFKNGKTICDKTCSNGKRNELVKNVDSFYENDNDNYTNQQVEKNCIINKNMLYENTSIINNMNSQVKKKIEIILYSYKSKKINICVQEILEIVNSYPGNKDIYINKNLLLPFYIILIKKGYYKNNLKNNIYENCFMNIFDYIHYNANEHLKFYSLKNIHELLICLSKYLYKNKANLITENLIKNIFYFSFFSHFNNFNYKTSKQKNHNIVNENKYINQTSYLKEKKELSLYECHLDKNRNLDIKQLNLEKSINDVKFCEKNKDNGLEGKNILFPQNEHYIYNNKKGKKKKYTYYEETFFYLKSYVIFLSNHPKYANQKILYSISTLANQIVDFEINSIMLLSFLSANLNLLKKYCEQNISNNSLFINRNANYHILHTILKDFNLRKVENEDKIKNEHFENNLHDNVENELNTNEGYSLWCCSHIINIIKIFKIKNILFSKAFKSDEKGEKCLQEAFTNIINKLDIFYLNNKNNFISISKNEIDSFFCIYINLSILLNEVTNKKDIFFLISKFFKNSFQSVYIYFNNLYINMLINLMNGLYNQISAYSKISVYDIHFENILNNCFSEEIDCQHIITSTHLLEINSESNLENNPITYCLYLVKDVGTCLLHSIQEQSQIPLTKLITVLNYIHKINKIFLPYNIFNILIFNYIDEIQKNIKNDDKKLCNNNSPGNHHILIFMNIYLYHKNENILNFNLLKKCINLIKINEQNIGTIKETEILMLLNFFKKYYQIKRKNINTNLITDIQNKTKDINNLNKHDSKVNGNINENVELLSRNSIFKFLNQKHEEYDSEHFELYINKCIYKIVNKLIFSYTTKTEHNEKGHLKNTSTRFDHKTNSNSLNDTQLKMNGNKINIPHSNISNFSQYKLNFFQNINISKKNENLQYSINLYFILYEIYFRHYIVTEKQKEVSLPFLTNLIKLKKNNLNEENYYHIISCFLSINVLNHNIYYLYEQYIKNNYKKINKKYVLEIMKKIFENFVSISNVNKDKIKKNDNFIFDNKNSINQNYIIQIDEKNSIIENIIYMSCNSLMCDIDYIKNFRYFKEIFHEYCENYINCYIIRNNFNYFSLSYFNKFIYCEQIKLNKNVMIILLNTFSNLYYTINKHLHVNKIEKIDKKKNEKTGKPIIALTQQNEKMKKIKSEHTSICYWEESHEYINKETKYNDFIKNKLLKNITKIIQKIYIDIKRKNNANKKIVISNRELIDIIVALKNTKSRLYNILYFLSKIYINKMLYNKLTKVEHHVKYMNSIIYLDFINELNILYMSIIGKDEMKIGNINKNMLKETKHHFCHILFYNFLRLNLTALFVPNISTYILNIIMLYIDVVNYEFEKKNKILTKIIFFTQSLLKLYYVSKTILPNDLDKRNIFLIFLLFSLSNNNNKYINISSLPFDALKLFYNKIILENLDNLQTTQIHSSFAHHTIYNFVSNFFKKYSDKYKIMNEAIINFYNVDLCIEKNKY
ncbi:conserved Plasmodium protein, unknown function [Plasmodium berghei]|uniref:Uncharacterized protein n=2 Tax=Plasmodium berghei TaxID=5821 RepID=A0A509AD63_PLABA|nr:conserved Plasmodium protein, unknown function [Plasmodium berghei ANKA]CXH93409.1 conserved Plasmodium protein, unknown function [Plasmodium berghei]SCL90785.1 conserved Plasmodium protein, unknown function [Plasmodium berghei]SCM15354.1 conserved Plasmodium protein, unknown function [Plasmodium berghei]SCM17147.1 conserved Plasmodium protein, unknown function [Plasmodium berghei]SCN22155.1 conserved Plasmodium protein, unknown function [Plasmodium berghei]|eukprot:XP_034419938.1 conserved Plasmodium protein, unknown function [Plasmodium berghei ANKA]